MRSVISGLGLGGVSLLALCLLGCWCFWFWCCWFSFFLGLLCIMVVGLCYAFCCFVLVRF